MQTLLVVDGHNLLFQMFFGMPARIANKEGKPIQGTLGFVGALLKIIRMTEPTHVVALFDGEHQNERVSLDAQYKAGRVDYSKVNEDENPFSQLQDVYAALDFMGIRHVEVEKVEADDVAAAYVLAYGADGRVVIASFDSDFFQLIGDNVSVLRYRGKKTVLCDKGYIHARYGIAPEQYADLKALTGDRADHIPGAGGIGPKTAVGLLQRFGTLERILANAQQIEKPSVRASVLQNAERLRLNRQLIRLGGAADLPFCLEELAYRDNGVTTGAVLVGIGLK